MDGLTYTLGNRRLVTFQAAKVPIRYRIATPAEIAKDLPKNSPLKTVVRQ